MSFAFVNMSGKLIFHYKFPGVPSSQLGLLGTDTISFVFECEVCPSLYFTVGSESDSRSVQWDMVFFIKAMKIKIHYICPQGKADFIATLLSLASNFPLAFGLTIPCDVIKIF